ncbi:hypothetical protein [Methylophilus sp.]|uniref:hypothetical protein n=1 Tax=Methylophilus sp. TaxID=29541 RepID=UPI0040358C87
MLTARALLASITQKVSRVADGWLILMLLRVHSAFVYCIASTLKASVLYLFFEQAQAGLIIDRQACCTITTSGWHVNTSLGVCSAAMQKLRDIGGIEQLH